jgi:hypothetical protein
MPFGLPYPVFDWLARTLGADGEGHYDAMFVELGIEFFVVFLVLAVALDRRFSRKTAPQH